MSQISKSLRSALISSRYSDPAEIAAMQAGFDVLRPADRRLVASVWCNSKSGWITLTLEAHAGRLAVSRIGEAFLAGLVAATGAYCMLSVKLGEFEVEFDGGDVEEAPDDDDAAVCPACHRPFARVLH